jgi:predicted PhzF superfamily epimerase YddE/YHI9
VLRGYLVDAFTSHPFGGNPAGVVLLDEPRDAAWMQHVATEFNLSETAFVGPEDAQGRRPLRWFTPGTEVELCGHATLAAGHILGDEQHYLTHSGELMTTARADGWVEMDFPADPPRPLDSYKELVIALGGTRPARAARGVSDILAELPSAADVRNLRPDLARISEITARGIIVTAPGDVAGVDFISRCFYPALGVPEDPVTGSAHCTLACWWAGRLGRPSLVGEQVSARGGQVRVALRGDRVMLLGQAVTVARTALLV